MAYLEGLPEPHILFDSEHRILAANSAYRALYGQQQSVVGRTCHAVSHHSDRPCHEIGESCPLEKALESGQRERVLHLHHTSKGQEYFNIELIPIHPSTGGAPTLFIEKLEPLRIARSEAAAQGLTGKAPIFSKMLELLARVAPTQANVLILGESGTGKELVAHAIHETSQRQHHPIVVVDCASLPESLFESELFGHEKGAFTGALQAKPGLVEAAHRGTLFLDEVGDIPLTMQVKLLRLLESGTYRRVGSTELRKADIRVVSATHRNLHQMCREGKFREDLLFRLSTFPLRVPALRERTEDIGTIAASLLRRIAPARQLSLHPEALAELQRMHFPGNVRELRNILERAIVMSDGTSISREQLQAALALDLTHAPAPKDPQQTSALPPAESTLSDVADAAFLKAFQNHQGSRAELARQLGISPRTLYRKLAQHGLI